MQLFHGSQTLIEKPVYGFGNPKNDYGLGFYCTESKELACEWSCPVAHNGICNEYRLDISGLSVVDLRDAHYTTLNWLALLVANRSFESTTPLMVKAKQWLLEAHLPNLARADVIIGHRADDSYYSFARSFLDGRLCLADLERALELGGLGYQVVLISQKAFDAIEFVGSEETLYEVWHRRRLQRDKAAREAYKEMVAVGQWSESDVYVNDLMRGAK